MKKTIKYISTLLFLVLIYSCTKEFIVKDIKNETVKIMAPVDNLNTPSNTVTFWWEELDGAEEYNLQIVKPTFNSVIQLLVDTTITGNKFTKVFTPGNYQWRIRAMNGGGNTAYTTRSLTIDTTSNLGLVTVNSISPIGLLTGANVIDFKWSALNAAEHYEINILNGSGASIFSQNNITSTSFSYTFVTTTDLVNYQWQVKAHNSFSFSQYNTPNSFTIDVTAPYASTITHPNYGDYVIGSSDSLVWLRDGSAVCDSVIISLDSNFNSVSRYSKRHYDKKLKFSTMNPTLSTSLSGNNYYWVKILTMDSVKNISAPSSKFKFKIN
jgi:hypothetical protein